MNMSNVCIINVFFCPDLKQIRAVGIVLCYEHTECGFFNTL